MTFCILALTHAVDIREMVARDAEDAMDRGYFEDDNSMRINIERMKIAGDNAIGRFTLNQIDNDIKIEHIWNKITC